MPVPSRLQDQAVSGSRGAWALLAAAAMLVAAAAFRASAQPAEGAAWFVRSLDNPAERRESGSRLLDTPLLPGSIVKVATLAAALESHTIERDTARMCRRVVMVDGRRYACSHPDLKRPLSPAEALAHSCNDFFVSLAPRLPRQMVNDVRARVGLPAIPSGANYAAALVGLDGPRVSPRALLDMVARVVGRDRDRAARLDETTRRVLVEGLRGAAAYGSASELAAHDISALAKTGTAPTRGGDALGLVVVLTPAENPTRGIVVVAPGAAGRDAASIATDLLRSERDANRRNPAPTKRTPAPGSQAATVPSPRLDAGAVRVGLTDDAARPRIETLPLEEYVARVLAGEGQPRAGDAAQEALAIAIRTFALANLNRHRREGFDLCDTTHCQVLRASTPGTRRAAQVTAGRVLVHQSEPAAVFYSAWCGGRLEQPSRVWPGASDYATEPSQSDDACRNEPPWTSEITVRDLERALRAAGLRGDRLRGLRVLSRTPSGRVDRLRVEGFAPGEMTGDDFRIAIGRSIGWHSLKSTMFDVRGVSTGYVFNGRGFGHGVGLCVVGAGARAARGESRDEILRFYYPGLRVQQVSSTTLYTARAPVGSAPLAPATAAVADVLVALPAGEESERDAVIEVVRRARETISARSGIEAPANIRVTVHPTVESFSRVTGQPWWISGATDRTSIDLIPLRLLQQRGQFERTIQHEVAHVLLDAALASRPIWVREGAALYFSSPGPPTARPARLRCPADSEFLRPVSAGAHRDAYARAEACFRRQILEGKNWREVR